jgi:hypothetical protein
MGVIDGGCYRISSARGTVIGALPWITSWTERMIFEKIEQHFQRVVSVKLGGLVWLRISSKKDHFFK